MSLFKVFEELWKGWTEVGRVKAEEEGNRRLKVMEGSRDEEMEEKGEMKGDREMCGGRPGGDQ